MTKPIIKKNYKRYCKEFKKCIESKPDYYMWNVNTLSGLFNSYLPNMKKLNNKQLSRFIGSQKDYIVFKNNKVICKHSGKTSHLRYLFLKVKR